MFFDTSGHQSPRHEMILEETQPSGADVWSCPECGRRIVMRWLPDYDRVVLDPGDRRAIHVGGTGGVRIGKVEVTPGKAAGDADAAWRQWLDDHGIDWDGSAA